MAAGGAEGRHRPDRAGTAVAVVGRGGGPEGALEHAQASPGDVAFGDPVGEDTALDDGFDVGAGDPRDDLDELCGGLTSLRVRDFIRNHAHLIRLFIHSVACAGREVKGKISANVLL